MTLVYRIEDKTNSGPYRGRRGSVFGGYSVYKGTIHTGWEYFICMQGEEIDLGFKEIKHHPVIDQSLDAKGLWIKTENCCGFSSLEQMLQWFDERFLIYLHISGFQLSVIETSTVIEADEFQIMFPSRSKRIERQSLLGFVNMKTELRRLTDELGKTVEFAAEILKASVDPLITPGCYIETESCNEAVVTKIDGCWTRFRYEAVRPVDKETLWVENAVPFWDVEFLREPDEFSTGVLTLKGPYGED